MTAARAPRLDRRTREARQLRADQAWRRERLALVTERHAWWTDLLARRYDLQAEDRAALDLAREADEAARAEEARDERWSVAGAIAGGELRRAEERLARTDHLVAEAVAAQRDLAAERDYHERDLGRAALALAGR